MDPPPIRYRLPPEPSMNNALGFKRAILDFQADCHPDQRHGGTEAAVDRQ